METLAERTRNRKPLDERSSFLLSLESSPIGFGVCVRTEAAEVWDKVEAMRAAWLARNNKRLPPADWLERQRYPRPYNREARNG